MNALERFIESVKRSDRQVLSHGSLGATRSGAFLLVLLHVSFNPIRLKDKNMQQIKALQRPLRV
ncbi:hypothetical protein GOA55_09015 [Sinorhizobium meliloti]|nr:hypothetical protein [Sinorhizobium meliloti]